MNRLQQFPQLICRTQFLTLQKRHFSQLKIVSCHNILMDQRKQSVQCMQHRDFSIHSIFDTYRNMLNYFSNTQLVSFLGEQYILVHEATELPWWIVIIGVSVSMRMLVMLPSQIISHRVQARRQLAEEELQNESVPALKKYLKQQAILKGKKIGKNFEPKKREVRKLRSETMLKYNIHPMKIHFTHPTTLMLFISQTVALRKIMIQPTFFDEWLTGSESLTLSQKLPK